MDAGTLFRVDGLVAVITGGGSGIGRMIALSLALNGAARVYILGRRVEKLQETASLSPHSNIVPVQADVTSPNCLLQAVDRVKSDIGYVNVLVCNSGISGPPLKALAPGTSIQEVQQSLWVHSDPSEFNKTLEVNITSVLSTVAAFLGLLDAGNKKQNVPDTKSQIIVTASVASYLRTSPPSFAYSTSKAAVNHLAKALSGYLVPYDIRVNILNPGVFVSEMTEAAIGRVPSFTAENLAGKRIGNEKDIIGVSLFLCSTAGAYLNGLSLVVDGGTLSVRPSTY